MDLSRLDFSLFKKSEGAPKAPSVVSSQVGKSAKSVVRAHESTSSSLAKNNPRERRKSTATRYSSAGLNTFALDLGNLSTQLQDLQESISKSAMDEVALNATRSALVLTRNIESLIDARGLTRVEKEQIKSKLQEVSKSLDTVRSNLKSRNDLFFERQGDLDSSAVSLIKRSQTDVDLLKKNIAIKIGAIKASLETPPRDAPNKDETKNSSILNNSPLSLSVEKTKLVAEFIVNEGPKVISTQLMPDAEKLIGILTQIEIGFQYFQVDENLVLEKESAGNVAGKSHSSPVNTYESVGQSSHRAEEKNPFSVNG